MNDLPKDCLQASLDEAEGLHHVAPAIAPDQDAITQLAGLYVLASVIYNPLRDQQTLSGQLQAAGLYESVLALLLMHSQQEEEQGRASDRGCLDWLEASHVGSPVARPLHMASVPEDCPVSMASDSSMSHQSSADSCSLLPQFGCNQTGGNITQNGPASNSQQVADSTALQQASAAFQHSHDASQRRSHSQTDAMLSSMPATSCSAPQLHSDSLGGTGACIAGADSANAQRASDSNTQASSSATLSVSDQVQTLEQASNNSVQLHRQTPQDTEPRQELQQQNDMVTAGRAGMHRQTEVGLAGDLDLADQVMGAALEVLFKLACNPVHLQACR